jgi:hypothetical protein
VTILLGFYGFLRIANSLQAEFYAIYYNLCLAMDQGFNNVVLESNSTFAIGWWHMMPLLSILILLNRKIR